jgi:hypothetical protein
MSDSFRNYDIIVAIPKLSPKVVQVVCDFSKNLYILSYIGYVCQESDQEILGKDQYRFN